MYTFVIPKETYIIYDNHVYKTNKGINVLYFDHVKLKDEFDIQFDILKYKENIKYPILLDLDIPTIYGNIDIRLISRCKSISSVNYNVDFNCASYVKSVRDIFNGIKNNPRIIRDENKLYLVMRNYVLPYQYSDDNYASINLGNWRTWKDYSDISLNINGRKINIGNSPNNDDIDVQSIDSDTDLYLSDLEH